VAGFIGSPSMNFFDVTLVDSDGKLYVDGGSFKLEMPPDKAQATMKHKGQEVIFGIRPEDIYAKPYVAPNITEADMKATVDVTELMGNEIFLYAMTANKLFIARVDPRTQARAGDEITLAINMDRIHLFDPKTELRLL
jgi:multiple sugar transport system ATP-binding protein